MAPWRAGAELLWQAGNGAPAWRGVRYARQATLSEFETETPGYTLVNANLAWHLDTPGGNAWRLFVDGHNLLDEEARPHTSFLKTWRRCRAAA